MNYKVIAARFKKSFVSRKTKFLVATLIIATSSAFAQVPSYVPTNGLVGWWPFNGNANDESGNGYNGTVNGATLSTDRYGISNSAYSFTGTTNEISLNNSQNFVSGSFSVSAWCTIDILSPSNFDATVIGQFNGQIANDRKWLFGYRSFSTQRGVSYYICDNNGNFIPSNSYSTNWTPQLLTWYNVTWIFSSGNSIKTYINGVLNSNVTLALTNFNNTANNVLTIIGNANDIDTPNKLPWNGKIDDLGIWNRELIQQEITALYNGQSCIGNISPDGPTTFCAGNSVNLKSDVVGGTYQWRRNGVNITTNATSRTFKATSTGSYTCVATCNGTALTSNAIQVTSKTNAFASVTASGATSFCLGDSVTLNCTNLGSNYSVQWYRTNISMENATNYSTVVKQPGTYKVVTRNLTNGCSRISGSAITTSVNCRIAGDITSGTTAEETTSNAARLIDNELSQGVHIYPNPNTGSFNFTYDGEETGDGILQIINTMGQSIYNSAVTVQEGGYNQEIQLGDNYTKGIYIVRLLINGSYHDSRVMVR